MKRNEQENAYLRKLAESVSDENKTKTEQIKQVVSDSLDNNEEFEHDKLRHKERLKKSNDLNDLLNG